jgi:hypothetical protein
MPPSEMKVFISHSSDDKRFVRTLKADLNENGINTWVDEDELLLGDSLVERLENSIDDTSHFLIVLSESSINSFWVQKELNKVLSTLGKKIIPVKYKSCEVPESLKHMLYGDVSNITRITDGDRLRFNDNKYYSFVDQLVRSLKSKDRQLSKKDKSILIKMDELPANENNGSQKTYLNLIVKGFSSNEVKEKFISDIKAHLSQSRQESLKNYLNKPSLLPLAFKSIYPNIKIGDKIGFKNKQGEQKSGLFAGFRKEEDDVIILPVSVRNYLDVQKSDETREVVVSNDKFQIVFL